MYPANKLLSNGWILRASLGNNVAVRPFCISKKNGTIATK